ncbi:ATP-binding cassette domain-containing protein [Hahella sp. KA22]|uniref:ABC transporter ATP-binding protein n=1 Tax=Hahella sp. KA22 TaxID=1628392 RepID=UPI000FDD38DB|nr:ABC transporter ATP-binding protein [Hahella sp. KA22]AZZ92149.1 ABC transporter ATP-binding protein [Hahella sp. KA22]QAY55520.1 ATP-binding cassette domain-containing protein [Hahella sp. KA22]
MTRQPSPLHIDPPPRQAPRLRAQNLTVGYEQRVISENLNVAIPDGSFTVIVGPNGCGKSTLLRSLCRLLKPVSGEVLLDGQDIHRYPAKLVARQLGLLPQSANTPEGIRVRDLVARGRYPHQSAFRRWSRQDENVVNEAMINTGVEDLADRLVDELSGGQRQRVWVAMALAQQTSLLLLDEPTTYLDITHQIELLELFRTLNRRDNRTLVAVLHDLNHACRYATHLIAMRDGAVIAEGPPARIISEALVEEVFGLPSLIIEDPVSHTPLVIPRGKETTQALTIAADARDSSVCE